MVAPRTGREDGPRWPLARPEAKFEEDGEQPEEDALKTIFGRKRILKKMHAHSG
jgi:hypothetical protein